MNKIKTMLAVDFNQLTRHDWDSVLIITGDEGISKSTLGLHILDFWYFLLNGQASPADIKHVCLSMSDFVTDLKELKRFDLIIYDEAGELSNLRVMNKFNYNLTQAYQVIRGLNIYTILILPSIFDLNSFFSGRRARGLLHVYKRGRVAFWNRDRLRKIIMLNKNNKLKNIWRVPPLWRDNYPVYEGVLKEPYKAKKEAKIKEIRLKLYEEFFPNDNEKEYNKDIEVYNSNFGDGLFY